MAEKQERSRVRMRLDEALLIGSGLVCGVALLIGAYSNRVDEVGVRQTNQEIRAEFKKFYEQESRALEKYKYFGWSQF